MVHRDLKPANVMLTPSGEPVVTDFGLAKVIEKAKPVEAKLTTIGTPLGTPSYMSPEQIRGKGTLGPATDLHSLGVILFEMLTGRTPYAGATKEIVMAQTIYAPVPPVREFREDVDAWLEAFCLKAMAKEAGERFAGMAEFAAALGRKGRSRRPS